MSLWHVARRFFLALALLRDLLVVSALLPRVRLCDSKTGAADRKTRRLLAWLLLQNVSGPLDREANSLEGERTSPDAVSPWALKIVAKTDARAVSPPRGIAH